MNIWCQIPGRGERNEQRSRWKCQYKNAQKVENKNVHFPRATPQPATP